MADETSAQGTTQAVASPLATIVSAIAAAVSAIAALLMTSASAVYKTLGAVLAVTNILLLVWVVYVHGKNSRTQIARVMLPLMMILAISSTGVALWSTSHPIQPATTPDSPNRIAQPSVTTTSMGKNSSATSNMTNAPNSPIVTGTITTGDGSPVVVGKSGDITIQTSPHAKTRPKTLKH